MVFAVFKACFLLFFFVDYKTGLIGKCNGQPSQCVKVRIQLIWWHNGDTKLNNSPTRLFHPDSFNNLFLYCVMIKVFVSAVYILYIYVYICCSCFPFEMFCNCQGSEASLFVYVVFYEVKKVFSAI